MTSRAVVFESRYAGHVVGFAAEIAAAFASAGFETTLMLNGAGKGRPQLAETVAAEQPFGIEWTEPFEPAFASAEHGAREIAELERVAARMRPARLAVPTGDALARAAAGAPVLRQALGRLPRMDIVLHLVAAAQAPRGRASFARWRRGVAELRALRPHRVLTCDPYAGIGPGRWPARLAGSAAPRFLPHPLLKRPGRDRAAARAHFGVGGGGRVLVSTGDTAPRKGIDRLLAAISGPAWPAATVALLAGPVSSAVEAELRRVEASHPDRLRVIDRFLSDEEFADAFVAADAIWAVTPGHLGVSSTFLYAALFGRPAVVAASHASARWMCNRIGPGAPTALDPAAIGAAVASALDAPPQTAKQAAFLARITDSAAHERIAVEP